MSLRLVGSTMAVILSHDYKALILRLLWAFLVRFYPEFVDLQETNGLNFKIEDPGKLETLKSLKTHCWSRGLVNLTYN